MATKSVAKSENQNKKEENEKTDKTNDAMDIREPRATKIYWKRSNLMMGSVIVVHCIAQLGENKKYQVLVTLAVYKGSKRYSKSKE